MIAEIQTDSVNPSDVFGYYLTFRVELEGEPGGEQSSAALDACTSAVTLALQGVGAEHGIRVDYSVSYECRQRVPVPVPPVVNR